MDEFKFDDVPRTTLYKHYFFGSVVYFFLTNEFVFTFIQGAILFGSLWFIARFLAAYEYLSSIDT